MTFWSYTQLALFRKCPQQFQWERGKQRIKPRFPDRTRVPTNRFIGTVFAQLMERLYRERWWRLPEDQALARLGGAMLQVATHVTVSEGILWPEGKQVEALGVIETALPTVLATMRRERLVGVRNFAEREVTFPLDNGDRVTGGADLVIEHDNGDLYVVDGKSGARRHAKRDQLRLYALGVLHDPAFGRLPTKVGFWFFREGVVSWRKLSPEALAKFRAGVQQTVDRIRAGEADPTPSPLCAYCPYVHHECAAGRDYLYSKAKDHGAPVETNLGTVAL